MSEPCWEIDGCVHRVTRMPGHFGSLGGVGLFAKRTSPPAHRKPSEFGEDSATPLRCQATPSPSHAAWHASRRSTKPFVPAVRVLSKWCLFLLSLAGGLLGFEHARLEKVASWAVAKVAKTFGEPSSRRSLGGFRYPETQRKTKTDSPASTLVKPLFEIRKIGKIDSTCLTVKVDTPSIDTWFRVAMHHVRLQEITARKSPAPMSNPPLRVFHSSGDSTKPVGSESRRQRELDRISGVADPKSVTLPVGKLVPLLVDAARHQRAWLDDFADDPVQIDADLYDVLLAYQQLRQRAA